MKEVRKVVKLLETSHRNAPFQLIMATTHITHSHFFFPSNKLLFFTAVPQPLRWQFRHLHGGALLAGVSASSPNKTSVARRRRGRSNVDLCNDLREFILEFGLPDGHVPSLKELSQHGRQDLAYLVRRRGYKLIRELLAASQEIIVTDSDLDGSLTGYKAINKEDETTGVDEDEKELAEEVLLSSEDIIIEETSSTETFNDYRKSDVESHILVNDSTKSSLQEHELTGLDENERDLAEEVLLSSKDNIIEETSSTITFEDYTKSDVESHILVDDSTKSSLQERVERFIQTGELEAIIDDGLDIIIGEEDSGSPNSTELELISASEESSGQVLCVSDSENSANGGILTFQPVNSASQLRSITSDDQLESATSTITDEEVEVEIKRKEDEAEINRIKVMLHHKELELSQLKEQIEKNKQAFSELQAIAETEISKAQKLVLDKDAELLAAKESLYGLRQVQLEYWGDGETVEVAGSFNGWHHGVKLDPQPSSTITDPVELRNTKLWRSMLWLYPGIYEMKFIVDGKWMIDPMKEVVYRGSIANNVLRVDRS